MKPIILFCLLLCFTTVIGQTGKLTGSVLDAETKTPLELATVSLFAADSSLVTYQLSDKHGGFVFDKLTLKKKYLVSVTYTGYAAFNRPVLLSGNKGDTLAVFLTLNQNDSLAVVVTAAAPVRMNGDTLEINPAAFKLKNDAVVEELMNQVPGMTIWSDGSITVNGVRVQNVLVDGKPFMGSSDPRIATQNLPKSAIDKIQLYQEYDRSNIGRERQPLDSVLTMNIKLKEASKKGYFGKAGGGYGTEQRFESDLSLQMYNKRSSIGVGGGFNNINKSIGNLQELFQNNTYRNFNPNLYSVGRFGGNGINRNHSLGGILTHNFIETANSRQNNRITLNYNTSGTDAYLADLNLVNRTTLANPQFVREEGVQNNWQVRRDLGVSYVKTNSYYDNLNVNGGVQSGNESGTSTRSTVVRDSAGAVQSRNSSNAQYSRRSENQSLRVSFARSDMENPLTNFNLEVSGRRSSYSSERIVNTIFQSFTDTSKSTTFSRRYLSGNEVLNIGGSLDYSGFKRLLLGRYNLFGINLNFNQRFNYSRFSDNAAVSDFDSTTGRYTENGKISNSNKRELIEYTPALTLSKSFSKWAGVYSRNFNVQFRILNDFRTERNESSIVKRNLSRTFRFFRYEGNMGWQYDKREKFRYYLSANYTRNYDFPSIDQLYTIVDDINVYDLRIGNPNLRNITYHHFSINANFNTQNPKSIYTFGGNINSSYNRNVNTVTDSVINDPSGKRTSYIVNADNSRNWSFNYNLNLSRKFKKNSLQLVYNGQFSASRLPNYVDALYNVSESGSLLNQLNLQFSLGSTLVMNASHSVQHYQTRQTAVGLTPFKNTVNSTRFGIVVNRQPHFTISSTVDYSNGSNLDRPVVLWNGFATYRFMKQQGELKLSAMDLLNQFRNISNSVNAYGTTTRITNGLQQYFLLTFSYYPRKFGKTEIKKQGS